LGKYVKVDTSDLGVAGQAFNDAIEDCYAAASAVGLTHDQLSTGWKAPSGSKFGGNFLGPWRTQFNKVVRELEAVRDALATSKEDYIATEEYNNEDTTGVGTMLAP